jgi:hypothetical protein
MRGLAQCEWLSYAAQGGGTRGVDMIVRTSAARVQMPVGVRPG